jgi:hypothetical protein
MSVICIGAGQIASCELHFREQLSSALTVISWVATDYLAEREIGVVHLEQRFADRNSVMETSAGHSRIPSIRPIEAMRYRTRRTVCTVCGVIGPPPSLLR